MKITRAITLAVLALANQVSAAVPVTGATSGIRGGNIPARQNINDLFNAGGPAWTLYIRALSAFMAVDPNDPESFFQISGIHGRPVIAWDSNDQPKMQMGYCPHSENIFLPWHRPYLALFEQVLVDHAIEIAAEYSDPAYKAAAETLRLPFWDWAEDATVPAFAGTPQIQVTGKDGRPQTIANPLYSYTFPQEAVQGKFGRIVAGDRDQTRTVRCTPSEANARLAEVNLKGMVYSAFTRSTTFENVGSMGSKNVITSFEQPHNSVHMRAGCGSHFAYTQEGAFDPLFMLHHANVDRLWALWEELYPSQKVLNPAYQSSGTFAIAPGTRLDAKSALLPFFGPGQVPQTSENVIDVTRFGYTYADLPTGGSAEERRRQVSSIVNKMYGPDSDRPDPVEPSESAKAPTTTSAPPSSSAAASSSTAASSSVPSIILPGDGSEESATDVVTTASASASATASATASSTEDSDSGATTASASASATATATSSSGSVPTVPSLPELPGGDYGDEGDYGHPAPAPTDYAEGVPDLDYDIDIPIEYFIHIKVKADNIPTPCEMNVYLGEKLAGSFAILTAPPSGYIEGALPIRRVLGIFGLLKGLLTDFFQDGKVADPVEVVKDNLTVEFVAGDGKVIAHQLVDSEYEINVEDVDVTPAKRPDELPSYGTPRSTPVQAKPAPARPGNCHSRRALPGDLPGVSLRI
ncbi:uncharacterized protein DNG_07730 [Cephalotrichum gorgonifer]|uniref:tyrosinase n=1 Tax=Cephalotrichum gorgonifer TaxID=2041049 RepID=A0AAE8N2C9_9PEZI|nr:uncharacterized protein DNG_07730 [Cephalotrichum gorgonifer]